MSADRVAELESRVLEQAERITDLEAALRLAVAQLNGGGAFCADCQRGIEWTYDELIEYAMTNRAALSAAQGETK